MMAKSINFIVWIFSPSIFNYVSTRREFRSRSFRTRQTSYPLGFRLILTSVFFIVPVNIEDTTQTDLFQESFSDYRTNNPADLSDPTDSARSEDLSSSGKSLPSADLSTFTKSISPQDPSKIEAVSPTGRRQRNLHGILGFLTGFRLAQGMGPTSYSADIRDSLDLNMFSRLFNAALFLSYVQNTNTLPLESVPTSYHPLLAYSQLSQNIFPTDLQLPVLYPPVASLQDFNDPARQDKNNIQTIDSNSEVIAQIEPNEQNKQDVNTTKISASENTTEEVFKAKSILEADKVKNSIDNKTQTDNNNDETTTQFVMMNNSTILPKHNVTIVTAVTSTEFNAINGKPMIKTISLKLEDPNIATFKKETNENHDKEGSTNPPLPTMQTEGAKPNNTSTVAHINNNSTEKPADMAHTEMPDNVTSIDHSFYPYPYPYYHDYENSSDYEHISITESPVSQGHFLKQHEYYENSNTYDNNYLPHQDGEQTHPPFVKGDQFEYPDIQGEHFHPMSIPYYDSQSSYESYTYQHDQIDNNNNNVQNNGFVPLGTLKNF